MDNQKLEIIEISFKEISGVRKEGELKTLDELIMDSYLKVYHERKSEFGADDRIPDAKDVLVEVKYQFERKSYEKKLNVGSNILTEENIALFLIKNKCIIKWGFAVAGDAQSQMFPDFMGDNTVLI